MADPHVLDVPTVAGNVAQSLTNVTALMADVMTLGDMRPSYSVHGHTYHWTEFYDKLQNIAERLQRQVTQLAPFEIISAAR